MVTSTVQIFDRVSARGDNALVTVNTDANTFIQANSGTFNFDIE